MIDLLITLVFVGICLTLVVIELVDGYLKLSGESPLVGISWWQSMGLLVVLIVAYVLLTG